MKVTAYQHQPRPFHRTPKKGPAPEGPQDKIKLSNPGILGAAAAGLYSGTALPLIGSAIAAATHNPLQLASALVGGAVVGGLLGGGIEALGRYRDPLSGWLRGAGMVSGAMALGATAGPPSVAVGIPLTGAYSYWTGDRHGARQVRSGGLRAMGWLAMAATNVAFPVLLHRAGVGAGAVALASALSVVSTMIMLNPDD